MILESPLTRVRELVVTGNASVTEQAILDASDLHKGMSLWQVNAAAIADKVTAAQPRVQSVTVHTDYLTGTVTLSIKEKQIVAVLSFVRPFLRPVERRQGVHPSSCQRGVHLAAGDQ